ncbi:CBS domain-containing protein, partial [Amycolatopsis sp. NPDC003861]
MTTEVTTVGPDTPFKAVALLLATWNISGAPVVDEDGKVLGVVSQGDLLEREAPHGLLKPGSRQAKRKAGAAFVADLMTAPAVGGPGGRERRGRAAPQQGDPKKHPAGG